MTKQQIDFKNSNNGNITMAAVIIEAMYRNGREMKQKIQKFFLYNHYRSL